MLRMWKSLIIIEVELMRTQNLIHPGEILQEESLRPFGISQTRLALDLHVPSSLAGRGGGRRE